MLEFFVVAVLALHGLVCTVILVLVLWRSSRRRDLELSDSSPAPDPVESYPPGEIIPIMAEHFPEEYEHFRRGDLPLPTRSRLWETCCAIRDARQEIEDLCSERSRRGDR
ncbi:MAG TPA: hypothetical protein VM737_05870 [Gemmatimonadota bacterium]|nr:hypothetical protein [Gemmatimonadota bacterium]